MNFLLLIIIWRTCLLPQVETTAFAFSGTLRGLVLQWKWFMAPRRLHTLQRRAVFLWTDFKIIFPHLFHKWNSSVWGLAERLVSIKSLEMLSCFIPGKIGLKLLHCQKKFWNCSFLSSSHLKLSGFPWGRTYGLGPPCQWLSHVFMYLFSALSKIRIS